MYDQRETMDPYATMVPVYTIYIIFVFQSELAQSELTEDEIICEYILVNNWAISSKISLIAKTITYVACDARVCMPYSIIICRILHLEHHGQ